MGENYIVFYFYVDEVKKKAPIEQLSLFNRCFISYFFSF